MRVLFIHQNFPGQFKHLAATLAADPANQIVAMTMGKGRLDGVEVIPYQLARGTSQTVHPWVAEFETKVIRGEAVFRQALLLRQKGFTPDIIVVHPGWGEGMFLKDVWPDAKLGLYCEFFYHAQGADVGFDPEFMDEDVDRFCRLRLKNTNSLLHFQIADAGIAPTQWQASTFPASFRERISVIHDGIDTDLVRPAPDVTLTLGSGVTLTRDDEVITFVNRNLEPYRGYHVFMRALPEILKARPKVRVMIVGGDGVSYGAKPSGDKSWKQIFLNEVGARLDMSRVHFLGQVPYSQFIPLMQLSTVHVYLTYPFVLSWSLLEAMSAGCAIIASDTAPLQEVITHGVNGKLTPFFDVEALAALVTDLLSRPDERAALGQAARQLAVERYDLRTVCLPQQLRWLKENPFFI